MNTLDKQYTDLLQDILDNGVQKKDRTGTGTISVFGRQIRHDMKDGFPLLTTKKMPWKTIVTELLWFLRGDTNIKYLIDNNCHIWDGDAYKNWFENGRTEFEQFADPMFMSNDALGKEKFHKISMNWFIEQIKTDDEFAKKWGELGPVYGKQWRKWRNIDLIQMEKNIINNQVGQFPVIKTDQIANLISDLKTNPDSRRLMVNAWNVGELDSMVLPPCHYGFQVYTRELSYEERCEISPVKRIDWEDSTEDDLIKNHINAMNIWGTPARAISLMWNQRSVDTFLGLPFNIASYGLLLEIIAKEVNMVPDELIGNLGDVHLYSNHIEQAKEQIGRHYTIEERIALIPEGVLSQESIEYFNLNKRTDSEINVALAKYRISPGLHTRQPFPLPTLSINTEFWKTQSGECGVGLLDTNLQGFEISDFVIENYQSHPTIKAPLSN